MGQHTRLLCWGCGRPWGEQHARACKPDDRRPVPAKTETAWASEILERWNAAR